MSDLDGLLFALTKVTIKDQIVAKHGNHDQKTHGRKGLGKAPVQQPRGQVREPGSFWAKYGVKDDDNLSWQEGTLIASGVLVGTGAGLAIGLNSQKIGQAYDDFVKYGMNMEGALAGTLAQPVTNASSLSLTATRIKELTTGGFPEAAALHKVFDGVDLGNGYTSRANLRGITSGMDIWSEASDADLSLIEITGDIMKGEEFAGHFTRSFEIKTGVMSHNMLIMKGAHQDSGAGNALFNKSIEAYKELGFVDEVEVHTAWVGGYNWARQGYQFQNGVMPDNIREMLQSEMGNKRNDARIKEEISTLLTRHKAGEVVTPQDIAGIGKQYKREVWRPGKPKLSMHAGKAMMIGQSWDGRLPITPKGENALAERTRAAVTARTDLKALVDRTTNPGLRALKTNFMNSGGASAEEISGVVADMKAEGFRITPEGTWDQSSQPAPLTTPIQDEIAANYRRIYGLDTVGKHLLGRHNQKTHSRKDHKKSESYLLNQDVKRWLTDEHEGGPVGSGIAYIRNAYERNKTKTALGRLFDAKAEPTQGILYRGIASNDEGLRRPGQVLAFGLSSFSSDPKVAFDFAKKRARNGEQAAVIRMGPGARGLDISPLYNSKTDTFRLHRRKKEYIVKDKAKVLHSYKSNGITVIEVKPTVKRKPITIGKHMRGHHNQQMHGRVNEHDEQLSLFDNAKRKVGPKEAGEVKWDLDLDTLPLRLRRVGLSADAMNKAGVDLDTAHGIMRGKRPLSARNQIHLADAMGISVEEFRALLVDGDVAKHLRGQHNQKEHNKRRKRAPKPKSERSLWNKMGYERDGKLSDIEFMTGLVGGMVAFSVGWKVWEGFNKVSMDRRYGDKIHQAIGDKLNSGQDLGEYQGLGFHPEGQRFRTGFRKWAARFENVRYVREYQATGVWENGVQAAELLDTAEKITQAEADTMINVLAAAPAFDKPIYRGVALKSVVLDSLKDGREIDMPISSFSRNKSVAMGFTTPAMIGTYGQKHVIFEIAPGARGVDVTDLLPEGMQWGEEVLSHGTYKVAGRSTTTIGKLIDDAQAAENMNSETYFAVQGWLDKETGVQRLAGLVGEDEAYDPEVTIIKLIQTATSFTNLTIQKRRLMV